MKAHLDNMHGSIFVLLKRYIENTHDYVTKVGKNVLILDYYSKRRMAGFAIGIIKGLSKHFGDVVVVMTPTDLMADRVQIKVDFISSKKREN